MDAPRVSAPEPGAVVTFAKTVSESDVYLFAGITGDLSPNHVDEAAMRRTPYGRRVAHGVLTLGFASTAATRLVERLEGTWVSAGYDRVRFLRPVFIGDTLTVTYRVERSDLAAGKAWAAVEVRNDRDELCAVAQHVLRHLAG